MADELFDADGQRDRHDEAVLGAFRKFTQAPKTDTSEDSIWHFHLNQTSEDDKQINTKPDSRVTAIDIVTRNYAGRSMNC